MASAVAPADGRRRVHFTHEWWLNALHLSNGFPLRLAGHDAQEKEGRKDVTDQGASDGSVQPKDKLH